MLFINATCGYLITQFARYFDLPVPCLTCSRLDHVFHGERVGFYGDLICGNHKLEISSLVLCRFHDKLVDVKGICENCLFSFAAKDKSNVETYRLMVGKFGADEQIYTDGEALLLDRHEPTESDMRACCCCDQPWKPRPHVCSLVKNRSIESEAADLDVSSFDEFRQKGNNVDRTSVSAESSLERGNVDPSPHFVYNELKVTSRTESEGHLDDKKDSMALVLDTSYPRENSGVESVEMEPEIKTLEVDSIPAIEPKVRLLDEGSDDIRTIHPVTASDNAGLRASVSETNTSDEDLKLGVLAIEPLIANSALDLDHESPTEKGVQVFEHEKSGAAILYDISEDHDGPTVESTSAIGHGLEELNWEADTVKVLEGPVSELIEIKEMQESSTVENEALVKPFPPLELIITDSVPEPSSSVDVSVEQLDNSVFTVGTREVEQAQLDEVHNSKEMENESTAAIDSNMKADLNDSNQQIANTLELGDAYKLAVNNRGRKLSGKLLEQPAGKDPMRVSGDLKLLWSQLSSPRGFELLVKDSISPRMSENMDDYWKSYDPSASIGMQILQKRILLDRSDSKIPLIGSSIESWEMENESTAAIDSNMKADLNDSNQAGEIEGESELDRLKRQVEHDKKLMSALCKELEEERNASADAANQAMAMITRLQEEKAAVQIEALQDIRMMEEQAEFDVEALEKLHGLLEQKEKEIQELQAALLAYQQKHQNEPLLEMAADPTSAASFAENFASELSRNSDRSLPVITESFAKDFLLEIEDERLYISRTLNKLEKKLQMFSNTGVYTDLPYGGSLEKEDDNLTVSKLHTEGSDVACEAERDEVSPETDPLESRSRRGSLVRRAHSFKSGQGSLGKREADVVTLGYELSSLNDRLLALEADRNFLEHAIYSLANGDEGLHFMREIASDLRELRRICVRRPQELSFWKMPCTSLTVKLADPLLQSWLLYSTDLHSLTKCGSCMTWLK
ncbi:Myosin-binding protein 1-like protein [Drosera capensis]